MGEPLMRFSIKRVFLAFVAAFATAIGSQAAMSGGGDEVDQKIEDAMVNVRGDRAWRLQGAPSVDNPIQLRSYSPGMASECSLQSSQQARWRYMLTPFFWTPGVSGTLRVRNNTVDVDASISDVLSTIFSNFDFAGMARFEADYCKWSIMSDFMYVDIGNTNSGHTPAGAQVDADWSFQMFILDAFGGYRFAELPLGCGNACFKPTVTFDAVAGFRLYHFETSIDLNPGPGGSVTKNWVDPVVGARALFHVSPELTFNAMANIGGFGVGSDLSWQLIAGLDYKVSNCVSLDAGWAVLSFDYKNGNDKYDLTMGGPYLGATFRF
jgi:hypothetical protein